jgi:phospholipid/cholesterol/gamma-HCH transport system substrate-binding protein
VIANVSRLRLVAVSLTTAMGLVVAGVVTVQAMKDEEPNLYVYFEDASPLIEGNDVKAGGVKVGEIGSIEVDDGMAKVGLVLDDEVLPLHEDATARVRPVGLLGERYVELDRGSADAPVLAEGATLSVEHTSRATDLDEVLTMVDGPTGTALSFLLTTLGQGVMGRGENVDRAIRALAPALQDTDRLAQILDDQNAVLVELLTSVEPVAQQLALDDGRQLDALLQATDDTLAATARNDAALADALEQLPSALNETRATLAALAGAAGSTTPVLRSLRPLTDDLVEVSQELDRFSRSAAPALEGLDPVLEQARVLIARARPVARTLASLSPDMRSTADRGRVIATSALDNLSTIMDFVKYWALTTNGQDGLSHYFRAHLVVTDSIATGFVPDAEEQPPTTTPEDLGPLDLPGQLLDGAGPLLDGVLGGLTPPLDGLLGNRSGRTAERNSATGLTPAQELSLVTYLTGGK